MIGVDFSCFFDGFANAEQAEGTRSRDRLRHHRSGGSIDPALARHRGDGVRADAKAVPELRKNGVLMLASVTGGNQMVEVCAAKIT